MTSSLIFRPFFVWKTLFYFYFVQVIFMWKKGKQPNILEYLMAGASRILKMIGVKKCPKSSQLSHSFMHKYAYSPVELVWKMAQPGISTTHHHFHIFCIEFFVFSHAYLPQLASFGQKKLTIQAGSFGDILSKFTSKRQ